MNANKGIRGLSLWKEGALLFWIVVGLGVVEVTTLIGILGGMNELGVSRVQLFDYVTFPFLLLFTVVLSMSTMRKAFGQKQMTYLMPLAFVIVVSLLSGGKLGDIALALAVLMMISAIIVGLQRGLMPGQMAWSIGKFSMLAGVSIILVGVVISSTMVSSQSVILSQNQSISVSGISVDMTGATLSAGQTSVFLPYYGIMPESVNLNVGLQVGTPSKTSSLELRYYPSKDQFYSQPLIVGNWLYDVYITASPTGEIVNATSALLTNHASLSVTSVAMVVEVIQGVSLIWIGLVMTVVGGSLFLIKTGGNRSDSWADSN